MAESAAAIIPNDAFPGAAEVVEGDRLRQQLARSQRLNNLRAFGLVAPLLLFIILSFVVPILMMLQNAVYDPDIRDNLPEASAVLADWDGKDLPGEEAYAALVRDFAGVRQKETAALIGKRMNYEISGIRSKIISSVKKAEKITAPPVQGSVDRRRQDLG